MWVKWYLIQPILSCHISLYKISLYKSLWLYHYSFILYTARYKTNLVRNGCTGDGTYRWLSVIPQITCVQTIVGPGSSMIVNLGGEVVGSAEDTMKGKVDALYAMFDDLIHCVNEVAIGRISCLFLQPPTQFYKI